MPAIEKTYLQRDHYRVTSARFVAANRTYFLNGITSIGNYQHVPFKSFAWLLIGAGLILAAVAFSPEVRHWSEKLTAGAAAFLFAGAGASILLFARRYSVVLHTAGGEIRAVDSFDRELVWSISSAITRAITERG